jgi:hypothetical protein
MDGWIYGYGLIHVFMCVTCFVAFSVVTFPSSQSAAAPPPLPHCINHVHSLILFFKFNNLNTSNRSTSAAAAATTAAAEQDDDDDDDGRFQLELTFPTLGGVGKGHATKRRALVRFVLVFPYILCSYVYG